MKESEAKERASTRQWTFEAIHRNTQDTHKSKKKTTEGEREREGKGVQQKALNKIGETERRSSAQTPQHADHKERERERERERRREKHRDSFFFSPYSTKHTEIERHTEGERERERECNHENAKGKTQ
jgi:hypothetical protein